MKMDKMFQVSRKLLLVFLLTLLMLSANYAMGQGRVERDFFYREGNV